MGCRTNSARRHSCRLGRPRGWRDYPTGPWRTVRAGPAPLFALFYQVEIRHRHLRRYRRRLAAGGAAGLQPRALSRGSALRQDAFDAQPQRGRVADERQLDGLAGQGLGLPREQSRGGNGVLLRHPTRRSRGFPDRPFSNGRPRPRPAAFAESPSVIRIPRSSGRANPAAALSWKYAVLMRQFVGRLCRNELPARHSAVHAPGDPPTACPSR